MRFQCLQHVPYEGPGVIADWMQSRGHTMESVRLYAGELPDDPKKVDGAVVMGGPMNVYENDAYPWLRYEKVFLREMLMKDKHLLGICLGAQLLAVCLGGEVFPNTIRQRGEKEIGWFPVYPMLEALKHPLFKKFPAALSAFHWHGDTFSLPEGAQNVLYTPVCLQQGFIFNDRAVGLQCHFEVTPEGVEAMMEAGAAELAEAHRFSYVQPAKTIREAQAYYAPMHAALYDILDAWLAV